LESLVERQRRSCISLIGAEGVFHGPQLLVAQHGLQRVGVGAQHDDAVEFPVLLDLVEIDGEAIVVDRLKIAAIAGVAHHRLAAFGELAFLRRPRGEHCIMTPKPFNAGTAPKRSL
jgi:hypothetical protein